MNYVIILKIVINRRLLHLEEVFVIYIYVYKGPTKKTSSNIILNKTTIKLNPFNMSLLVQTIINFLISEKKIKSEEIEHYISICNKNNIYRLKL